jgi:lysine decarboxylase
MSNMPIVDELNKILKRNTVSFHVPGHKWGRGFLKGNKEFIDLIKADATEIDKLDNLHYPEGIIKQAQKLLSIAYKSKKSYFLVNGSTCGIQAALTSVLRQGDKVVVVRDCHLSVVNILALIGAEPVYVYPEYNKEFGIYAEVSPKVLEACIMDNSNIKAILITRPNYYGVCSDIEEIVKITKKYNKVLIVDEAHGAHLAFNKKLPACAMDFGVDITIQSAHKTLSALTQGAYLHVGSELIDIELLEYYLRVFQTTSPSYLIMASLDYAREQMERAGCELLSNLLINIDKFREKINKNNRMYYILDNVHLKGALLDRTKIVVGFKKSVITGYELLDFMNRRNIIAEMAGLNNIVFYCSINNNQNDFDDLFKALTESEREYIDRDELKINIFSVKTERPKARLKLGELRNYKVEKVTLEGSVGRISFSALTPYPPGIPIVCPGEEISYGIKEYFYEVIKSGGHVSGIDKDKVLVIIES